MKWFVAVSAACLITASMIAGAQDVSAVSRMAENERAARVAKKRFSYLLAERSPRTAGHLWLERVVEVDDGPVRRLLSVDGQSLSRDAAQAEQQRLNELASHPDAFRKLNASSAEDEAHLIGLLNTLPSQFILTPAGTESGCVRFNFRPNPAYQPSSMEQRVLHVMEGHVSLREPEDRLCSLDGVIARPVTFGFGLLGKINQGGNFSLVREPVMANDWKTIRMTVHLDGKILLMKSLTRDQEAVRTEVKEVPQHLTLGQAVALSTL